MDRHGDFTLGQVHQPFNWSYADATARTAATGMVPADVGKWAKQLDNGTYWELTDDSPVTWAQRTDSTFGGSSSIIVEEGDSTVVATVASLDFDSSDFNVTEAPSGEANISLNYGTGAGQPAEGNHTHTFTIAVTLPFGDQTNVITSAEPKQRFVVPVGVTFTKRIVRSEDGTSGSIEFLVKRAVSGSTSFTEISASPDRPLLSTDTEDTSTDFSSWTDTTLDPEDIIELSVNGSPTSVKDVTVTFLFSRVV